MSPFPCPWTPGPWEVTTNEPVGTRARVMARMDSLKGIVAVLDPGTASDIPWGDPATLANARLAAGAPGLHDALAVLVLDPRIRAAADPKALEQARVALAAAGSPVAAQLAAVPHLCPRCTGAAVGRAGDLCDDCRALQDEVELAAEVSTG